ncbi:hypothetical protein GCM10011386_00190 [Parapedobacter defluvii]|uniref:HTH araC/xylS-type domain-containing protein n=2 Tax=Parapedobacter defluvii TaxID=2045106 RepID=A0ABQ1KZE2_9SPHI|nr:hypothetical protein GCM10011386_00190 [Parapedobacter defluvii]
MYKTNIIERISEKRKTDPSGTKQLFNDFDIKIFCCRYWVLEEWDCVDLSVPFWRLYHNTLQQAAILFDNHVIPLNEDKLIIIPPHTSFSTRLRYGTVLNGRESIVGRRIHPTDSLDSFSKEGKADHLFIHFHLGFPSDFVKSGVYAFDCDQYVKQELNMIKTSCQEEDATFNFFDCLRIKQLILRFVAKIPKDLWKFGKIDYRIFDALQYIDAHFFAKMSNDELAYKANMAVNSFARLFKLTTGTTVQQYILKTRVEKACGLMHHSSQTIDQIAYNCGFSDRYHFSKIFKQVMGVTPAFYKKANQDKS